MEFLSYFRVGCACFLIVAGFVNELTLLSYLIRFIGSSGFIGKFGNVGHIRSDIGGGECRVVFPH